MCYKNLATGAGDNNADHYVDGTDFLAWQRGFGATSGATRAQGGRQWRRRRRPGRPPRLAGDLRRRPGAGASDLAFRRLAGLAESANPACTTRDSPFAPSMSVIDDPPAQSNPRADRIQPAPQLRTLHHYDAGAGALEQRARHLSRDAAFDSVDPHSFRRVPAPSCRLAGSNSLIGDASSQRSRSARSIALLPALEGARLLISRFPLLPYRQHPEPPRGYFG